LARTRHAISSTTISGQDEVTQTARIVIESGDPPLYVILTSYEVMIWRFEGDVSRVRQVVLLGWSPHGVTGIATERVTDLTGTSDALSGYFDSTESPEGRALRNAVEGALGRPVDVMAGSYTVGTLSLPSVMVQPSPRPSGIPPAFDASAYQLGLWFNPGGIVDMEPALVVSSAVPEPYEILPEGFGLAQLVAAGGLEQRNDYFYIARSVARFPAGLYGAHAVTFVLGTGVPMPAGSPGHSCVLSEETGLPVGEDSICAIARPPTITCDLPEAPASDEVILFGAYEGDAISTTAIAGQDEETETARVVIAPGPTPLYVVLAAYESIIWRFEGATERIDRLVLMGYGAQGVTGVPSALLTNRSGESECAGYFYDVQSPEGVGMRRAVEGAIGRSVDTIVGSYSVGTLSLPAATVEGSDGSSEVPAGFDPAVYAMHGLRFNPGGVIDIDPALVIASEAAESYQVLPHGFGLAQLVATGALEHRGSAFFDGYFYIGRAIARFPAGLHGAHSVAFVLGRGVPLPNGSPGHSCVMSEETGLPLANEFLCPLVLPSLED
jgi:hypothetical protein